MKTAKNKEGSRTTGVRANGFITLLPFEQAALFDNLREKF